MMLSPEVKQTRIMLAWGVIQICQLIYIGSSWASVRDTFGISLGGGHFVTQPPTSFDGVMEEDPGKGVYVLPVEIFSVIWIGLFSLAYTFLGFILAKRQRTRLSLGFFVGTSFTMALWFIIFAVKAGHVLLEKKYNNNDLARAYVETRALFALLLCILYIIFGMLLLNWQDDLVQLSDAEKKAIEEFKRAEYFQNAESKGLTLIIEDPVNTRRRQISHQSTGSTSAPSVNSPSPDRSHERNRFNSSAGESVVQT